MWPLNQTVAIYGEWQKLVIEFAIYFEHHTLYVCNICVCGLMSHTSLVCL